MADDPISPDSERYHRPAYRYYTLAVLTLVYAVNFVDRQLLVILQEPIKSELGLSDAQLGLLTGFAFAIFYVSFGIPIARLADKWIRRNIVSLSLGAWSLMTAVTGYVNGFAQLLLARVGVGIGESGGSPPAHSMISDIFPVAQRATALAVYSTGINLGILVGFLMGGWINEYLGWRAAFKIVGFPGIVLAIIVWLTVREPRRGFSQQVETAAEPPSMIGVIRFLWSRRSFRHLSFATGLQTFSGYGIGNWTPSFLIRSHGMSTAVVGTWLALMNGAAGGLGTFAGGYISDRLANRDKRWYQWLPAIANVVSMPFSLVAFTTGDGTLALIMLILPTFLFSVYLAPNLAMTHALVGIRMRALASAVLFFILNLIGMGLGPLLVGALSDALNPSLGDESLRYSLIILGMASGAWSVVHYLLAAQTLREDVARAPV